MGSLTLPLIGQQPIASPFPPFPASQRWRAYGDLLPYPLPHSHDLPNPKQSYFEVIAAWCAEFFAGRTLDLNLNRLSAC